MRMVHKETERLVVRELQEKDADEMFPFMSRPDYTRWLPFISESLEELRTKMRERAALAGSDDRTVFTLAVVHKNSGKPIGDGTLNVQSPTNREVMVGWSLAAEFRGQGYGTELGLALLDIAFNDLNAHRVVAYCDPENTPSRRLMERIGMQYEGTLRDDLWSRDRWWTSVVCSILEPEYRAMTATPVETAEAVG